MRGDAPRIVTDVVAQAHAEGKQNLLGLATSAYSSYSGCRQYREDLAKGVDAAGVDLQIDKVRPYGEHPAVAGTWARLLTDAVRPLVEQGIRPHLLFVTHSIPESMDETSGPGDGEGRAYSRDQVALARALVAEVSTALGVELDGGLSFCSRSGPPHVPWLEPDVGDRITELAAEGVEHVVVAPTGFVSDHMEVVYDLDTEAAETAAEVGIGFTRVDTPQPTSSFVAGLVDLMLERAAEARGEEPVRVTWRDLDSHPSVCPPGCCPNLSTAAPALCGQD